MQKNHSRGKGLYIFVRDFAGLFMCIYEMSLKFEERSNLSYKSMQMIFVGQYA